MFASLEAYAHQLVEFVRVHEAWAAPVVFALAFGESLAFISLLIPAWAALVGIGVLIGSGDLNFWPVWVAAALGAAFARPERAAGERDLVVHTSATSAGLQRSLDLLGPEGTVIDLSWYGDTDVRLSLGGAFHSRRLGLRASQVGTISPARSGSRTTADRLALALDLLRDPAFDVLVTGESEFGELPDVMARLAVGSLPALCHTITYGEG